MMELINNVLSVVLPPNIQEINYIERPITICISFLSWFATVNKESPYNTLIYLLSNNASTMKHSII